ncbi:MAG: GNAT family N-acetyltransferase [Inquilinaceae bacterium]
MILRPARPTELDALSDLCLRSKAVWGYDAAFLDACRAELSLTADDLADTLVQVAEVEGTVTGVAQVAIRDDMADLEKLFVDPAVLRAGTGRALFAWVVDAARAAGARTLTIEADPDAAPFYRRMGARDAGQAPSASIPGRMLPRLELDVAE